MRQFAGFGTAEETNERFRYLLEHGQTGLSTAFDMPSLMGHDSDHPRSLGEVGREGVAIDTVVDMETLFGGIPLDDVTVSMTINAPAAIMLAFYVVAAERQGVARRRSSAGRSRPTSSRSTSPRRSGASRSIRRCGWSPTWSSGARREMPRWHPISISGYHIREAGSTAAQELAFTLKDGLTYVEHAVARGLDVDDFAPRLSFFFNAQIDFFEEIAKYRAARRIWARELRDTFGAQGPEVVADALPHPDRRRLADRPAAAEQHRPHGDRGAGRRARRHPVAAHQLLRRGARAADRGGGPDRAAHPADHRSRDRRDEHDRPARRRLLRRVADRPAGGARLRVLRQDRRARRDGRGGQARLPAARDRRRGVRAADARSTPAGGSSSASTATPRATTGDDRSCGSTRRSSASRSSGVQAVRADRDTDGGRARAGRDQAGRAPASAT